MKQNEAMAAFMRGERLMVVEYRGSVAQTIKWTDKTTFRAMEGEDLTHTVEAGEISFPVKERLESRERGSAEKRLAELRAGGLEKGKPCVLRFSSFIANKGAFEARGVLELLEPDSVKPVAGVARGGGKPD